MSFEQEIRTFLSSSGIEFADRSSSFGELDFTLLENGQSVFTFDAKEKRQRYNPRNWPDYLPEEELFILDDLAVRKALAFAPDSGICVRDNMNKKYFFYSIVDLALMPRLRVNRDIHRKVKEVKGKWLVDLSNASRADNLDALIDLIRKYIRDRDRVLFEILECFGSFKGEDIPSGGITRRPEHWDTDVSETR